MLGNGALRGSLPHGSQPVYYLCIGEDGSHKNGKEPKVSLQKNFF